MAEPRDYNELYEATLAGFAAAVDRAVANAETRQAQAVAVLFSGPYPEAAGDLPPQPGDLA